MADYNPTHAYAAKCHWCGAVREVVADAAQPDSRTREIVEGWKAQRYRVERVHLAAVDYVVELEPHAGDCPLA